MQRGRHERLLLRPVDLRDAGGRRGGRCTAGIEHRAAHVLLQAVTDLVPGALVLRFLLAPDYLAQVGIAVEDRLVLLARERIELLDAHQRDIAQSLLAARAQQIEVDLAAAEDNAASLCRRQLIDLADDARKRAAAQILERRYRQLEPQQALRHHYDERLAEALVHLPSQHVKHLRRGRGDTHLHVVLGAQLQEALETRGGMLRSRALEAVRQHEREPAKTLPLGFTGADELVDD